MPSSAPDGWADHVRDRIRDHERERLSSRYERMEEIGSGGMAVVYRARDRQLNRFVALKVLRDDLGTTTAAKRFLREAEAAARLSHPNLVSVHDVGEEGGHPFIVMELVEGGTLAEGKRSLRETVEIVRKAALAVDHAHQQGVVHRDLKPGNILVDSHGEPRVGDFGLAHFTQTPEALTRTGTQLGTPFYMSPEQVEGRVHDVDPRTDVWALGVILYELTTGRVPFAGEAVSDVYRKILWEDPPRPPKLAHDLQTICFKALEKEPHRRYATARAFAEDLQRWLTGEPIEARPAGLVTQLARRVKRNRAVAAAVVLALLACGGWAAFALRKPKPPPPRPVANLAPARELYEAALKLLYNDATSMDDVRRRALEGIQACDVALRTLPDDPETLHLRGRFHRLLGDEDAAERDFTAAGPIASLDRGRLRLERGLDRLDLEEAHGGRATVSFDDAIADLETARKLGIPGDDLLYADALVALVREQPDARARVEAYFDKARTKELAYMLRARLEDGAANLREATRRHPKYFRAWYELGLLTQKLEDLRRAADLNPRHALTRAAIGYVHYARNELDDAERWFREARDLEPDLAQVYLNLGNVEASRKRYAEAIVLFERTLELDANEVRAVINLSLAYSRLGRSDDAIREADRAIEMAKSAAGYLRRGDERLLRGEPALAKADFETALRLDPKSAEAHTYAAQFAPTLEEALRHLDEAIRLKPKHGSALTNRGTVKAQMRKFDEALKDYEKAIEVNPNDSFAWSGRGTVWFEFKKYDDALADLNRALDLDAQNEVGRLMRAFTYLKLSRWKECLADLEIAANAKDARIRERAKALIPDVRSKR